MPDLSCKNSFSACLASLAISIPSQANLEITENTFKIANNSEADEERPAPIGILLTMTPSQPLISKLCFFNTQDILLT